MPKKLLRSLRAASVVFAMAAAGCTDLATGPTPPLGDEMDGIDVSHWQGTIDWPAVRASGVDFAFIKATEGETYADPQFARNWAAAAQAGVMRGAYHYFRPGTDPVKQAENFLRVTRTGGSDLPAVLDVEVSEGLAGDALLRAVRAWLETVERATGKRPIVYTYPDFWNRYAAGSPGPYPLWIANYGRSSPTVPIGWTDWTFWQHTSTGRVPGIAGDVDQNRFNGGPSQLAALTGSRTLYASR
ncbi:MAG: glycoside hydrolase family 25 protein [Gemmatimonadetes bacterium]|nr:glycoside hydrolase family 25 protein [Gemmatimonadota bacterium]